MNPKWFKEGMFRISVVEKITEELAVEHPDGQPDIYLIRRTKKQIEDLKLQIVLLEGELSELAKLRGVKEK